VGNQRDLVGRYFREHPHLYAQGTWLEPSATQEGFYRLQRVSLPNAAGDTVSVSVQGFLSLSPALRAREGLLDFAAAMKDIELDEPSTGPIAAIRARALLAGRGDAPRAREVTLRAEQSPNPQSRVTLRSDLDELGMPRVDLRWQLGDGDLENLARGARLLARELGALGAGRVHFKVDDRGRLVGRLFGGGHHMGTTRMGSREEDGVVDADAKVFGVENLYVAGSSVFVTAGRANPTLTLVALAARLGDHLAGRPYEAEAS
jgi:choline dehydrogenase-like flavoprotein